MGRPLKPIDADEVYKLASIGCTQEEIAGFFGVDQATISRRFSSEYAVGHQACKISLRKRQWNSSKRSVPMQIHLGKHMLGQADRPETGSDGSDAVSEAARKAIERKRARSTDGPPGGVP